MKKLPGPSSIKAYKVIPAPGNRIQPPSAREVRSEAVRKLRDTGQHRLADKVAQDQLPLKPKKRNRQMPLF